MSHFSFTHLFSADLQTLPTFDNKFSFNQPIADFLRTLKKNLIADIPDKKPRTPWGDRRTSHSPIIIKGDRASYSLAVRRGKTGLMDDEGGAWFQDTAELEKSLLGMSENEAYTKK